MPKRTCPPLVSMTVIFRSSPMRIDCPSVRVTSSVLQLLGSNPTLPTTCLSIHHLWRHDPGAMVSWRASGSATALLCPAPTPNAHPMSAPVSTHLQDSPLAADRLIRRAYLGRWCILPTLAMCVASDLGARRLSTPPFRLTPNSETDCRRHARHSR